MSDKMNWTYKQNLKALCIYKMVEEDFNNDNFFPKDKFFSLLEKLKDFRSLFDIKTEKRHCSKDCEDVFYNYKDKSISQIKQAIKELDKQST